MKSENLLFKIPLSLKKKPIIVAVKVKIRIKMEFLNKLDFFLKSLPLRSIYSPFFISSDYLVSAVFGNLCCMRIFWVV